MAFDPLTLDCLLAGLQLLHRDAPPRDEWEAGHAAAMEVVLDVLRHHGAKIPASYPQPEVTEFDAAPRLIDAEFGGRRSVAA